MIGPDVLVLTEAVTLYLPELLDVLHTEVAARTRQPVEQLVRTSSFGPGALAVAAGAPVLAAVHRNPMALRTARSA
jgi:hypothetical protein